MRVLGKTETIKERSIYVYLPSIEHRERWENYARVQGTSISKFVIGHVENSLRQVEDPNYQSVGDLWRQIKQLREQLKEAEAKKHVLEVAMDRLEEELRKYRAQPFLEDKFVGVRRYQKELLDILREGRLVSNEEILERLGVHPSDSEAVRAISKQLENLEGYGLVRASSKGWKWVEQICK